MTVACRGFCFVDRVQVAELYYLCVLNHACWPERALVCAGGAAYRVWEWFFSGSAFSAAAGNADGAVTETTSMMMAEPKAI